MDEARAGRSSPAEALSQAGSDPMLEHHRTYARGVAAHVNENVLILSVSGPASDQPAYGHDLGVVAVRQAVERVGDELQDVVHVRFLERVGFPESLRTERPVDTKVIVRAVHDGLERDLHGPFVELWELRSAPGRTHTLLGVERGLRRVDHRALAAPPCTRALLAERGAWDYELHGRLRSLGGRTEPRIARQFGSKGAQNAEGAKWAGLVSLAAIPPG